MNFDEFTGQVQHRLELPGTGEVVRAIRATLVTLGQRIQEGEATDLASNLPLEIGWYVTGAVEEHGERFDWREAVDRIASIEQADPSDAAYHAQIIMDLVASEIPPSQLRQIRDQLPESEDDENWRKLFTIVDAGGWSELRDKPE